MSLTLTTTAATRTSVTIDLTLTPDTPSSESSPTSGAFDHSQSRRRQRAWGEDDVRTPKRPKLERRDGKREMADCLSTQIVPLVRDVTKSLSRAELKVDDIGSQVMVDIARLPFFKLRVDETSGFLTEKDIQVLTHGAKKKVAFYSTNPQYMVKQPTPPRPKASTTPKRADSTIPEQRQGSQYIDTPIPTNLQRRERTDRPFQPLVRPPKASAQADNIWYNIKDRRPYCSVLERQQIRDGIKCLKHAKSKYTKVPLVYHVDFSHEEVAAIVKQVNSKLRQTFPHTPEGLLCLIRSDRDELHIPSWIDKLPPGRTQEDVRQYCSDLLKGRGGLTPTSNSTYSNVLSLQTPPSQPREHPQEAFGTGASHLLLARELEGNTGYGRMRRHVNFQKDLKRMREDGLDLVAEYTGCSGDLDTFAWVSNNAFVCGATCHSDTFNQQYNKPGNLLLCSTTEGALKAYPDHRTERPLVERGENSSEAMRLSQSPWIYHSVVASDYDPILELVYTASYDKTVKVWKVDAGDCMECLATWEHDGIVNFVQCAKDGSGRVATASNCVDKPAVRIYIVDPSKDMPLTPDQELSCLRKDHLTDDGTKWAYYPATMQWGKSRMAQHLLAIGYSPRADSGHDSDIPEDKQHTGEITLWDAVARKRVDISNATTANVFEVVWHPTLPRFACATTRCGTYKPGTRTQVHIFKQDTDPARPNSYFSPTSLDCPACDINELTFIPNSLEHAYVTAACTDGRVYVWDTAFDSDLLYILKHGPSLETFDAEPGRQELMDTGVKFTAWGTTLDRFYTGGSDGVVNVWNLQDKQNPHVRKLLSKGAAPISGGAFSPDMQKLAIGDATGRVWLFSVDERDECEAHYRTDRLRPQWGRFRASVAMVPHPEPPPPQGPGHLNDEAMNVDEIKDSNDTDITPPTSVEDQGEDDDDVVALCQKIWLDTHQLVYSGNCLVGMVQGPNYHASNTFHKEAHVNNDPSEPLLFDYQKTQQAQLLSNGGPRRPSFLRIAKPDPLSEELRKLHLGHQGRDVAMGQLLIESRRDAEKLFHESDILSKFAYESESEDEV